MHPDYLEKVLNAQVYDVAVETPLDLASNLSARVGNKIILKREDLQPVFSFKLRGAFNKMVQLPPAVLRRVHFRLTTTRSAWTSCCASRSNFISSACS